MGEKLDNLAQQIWTSLNDSIQGNFVDFEDWKKESFPGYVEDAIHLFEEGAILPSDWRKGSELEISRHNTKSGSTEIILVSADEIIDYCGGEKQALLRCNPDEYYTIEMMELVNSDSSLRRRITQDEAEMIYRNVCEKDIVDGNEGRFDAEIENKKIDFKLDLYYAISIGEEIEDGGGDGFVRELTKLKRDLWPEQFSPVDFIEEENKNFQDIGNEFCSMVLIYKTTSESMLQAAGKAIKNMNLDKSGKELLNKYLIENGWDNKDPEKSLKVITERKEKNNIEENINKVNNLMRSRNDE